MAKFFKISSSIDLIQTEELLLRKYNISYLFNLGFEEGFEIIKKAFEKEVEERLWQRWLIDYKHMTKDTFISFESYKEKILNTNVVNYTTSKEDLLEMANKIESKITKKRGDGNGN